jgi:hypothetical protein
MNLNVYIAGPMSGQSNFNFPLFDYVAARLRKAGCHVFNPADHARARIGPLEKIQKMDKGELRDKIRDDLFAPQVEWICRNAQLVLMLPGWEHSEGSIIEKRVAHYFHKPVHELKNIPLPTQEEVLPLDPREPSEVFILPSYKTEKHDELE